MKNSFASFYIALLCCLFASVALAQPKETSITVHGWADSNKLIPITMSGFSGEVNSVLRFDLEIAGFEFVGADKAQFQVTGKNSGNVEGHLTELIGKKTLFSRSYIGNIRSQAHALANDIIFAITGKKGVAHTKIAFRVDQGNTSEIFVADYDGHNANPITADKTEVSLPAWVPGQRKLLYCSRKSGPIQIFSHDLNSGSRQIVAGYSGSNYSPAISPDGRRVAFIATKSGSPDLYVADIDGSNLKQLTRTREDESSPCWSPDSTTICYVGRSGKRAALFKISANGGEAKQLTVRDSLNLTEPDWSPDGKQIVFTRLMGDFSVCVVPADGGTSTVLVTGEDPSWAPNSRTVIFTRRQNNKRVLSLLDVPTKRVKDVAQISGSSSSQPSWSR
ncbi:MAG: PD40 domain-containing protein [Verrucomicrobia bacterium]|nr:PD40 domain-containing protein [Verrucomicrobiota bacterium]